MIGGKKPRGKLLGKRNGINIYAPTEKKPRTKIKFITEKTREKNDEWKQIVEQKIKELGGICQWCKKLGQRKGVENFLTGHHKIKRSRGRIDTGENCYVCHLYCHSEIEHSGIDVRIYPTKLAWENREK
jgi:hypothetical protein